MSGNIGGAEAGGGEDETGVEEEGAEEGAEEFAEEESVVSSDGEVSVSEILCLSKRVFFGVTKESESSLLNFFSSLSAMTFLRSPGGVVSSLFIFTRVSIMVVMF